MNPADPPNLTIHIAKNQAEIVEIQRFRYRVYITEMGMDLPGVDHLNRVLADPLDLSAVHIFAAISANLAGSVRLNLNEVPKGLEAQLAVATLARPFMYCSRLFVNREWRGSRVANALSAAAFAKFLQDGVATAVCHCYPHLLKFYRRLGFRPYAAPFVLPGLEGLGPQTPLCCQLTEKRSEQAA